MIVYECCLWMWERLRVSVCVCVCAVDSVCVRYNAMAPMFCSPNPLMTLKKP